MADVTRLLHAINADGAGATDELLPLVYDELRRLAAQRLALEKPGQTIQPTALVHEVYLRLVGAQQQRWESRGHFFAAAAQAMRRILVENARRRKSLKRGGGFQRVGLEPTAAEHQTGQVDLLALDEALSRLAARHARKARLVELRYFCGLTLEQAASALGTSSATAHRDWAYARAWLHRELAAEGPTAD
jgi:RNA polymerase sigma factor (TIGR02999 family)